jgi:DNA-binding protein YbaB
VEISSRVLNDMMLHAQEHAELIRRTRDTVLDIRVTEESDDGLVTVTVTAAGELTDLVLDPRIYRHPDADGLATAILDTIRTATDAANREAARQLVDVLGDDAVDGPVDVNVGPALHEIEQVASGKAVDRLLGGRR